MRIITTDQAAEPEEQPRYCFEIFEPQSRTDAVIVDGIVPLWLARRMELLFRNAGLDARLDAGVSKPPEKPRR